MRDQRGLSDRQYAFDRLVEVDGVPLPGGGTGSVEHRYGYNGARVSSDFPDGTTQLWFTAALAQIDDERQLFVSVGGRLVARVSRSWTGPPGGAVTSGVTHVARPLAWFCLLVFATALGWTARPRRGRLRGLLVPVGAAAAAGWLGCGSIANVPTALWMVSETVYYHQGIGAGPSLITRADQSVFEERRFEPFGTPIDAYREEMGVPSLGAVSFSKDPHGIQNRPVDATTGWSDHGARWLVPHTGRWLTPDPPARAPDPKFMAKPWSLHPYQYVEQNPILYWDPDGEDVYFVIRTNDREIDRRAAQTRVSTIHAHPSFDPREDAVWDLYVPDLGKLEGLIESINGGIGNMYGYTVEVSIFGHSTGRDGPRADAKTSGPFGVGKQLSRDGWRAIDFNWSPYGLGQAFAYGCRSYSWVRDTFVQVQPKVGWAAGHKGWSYPSVSPRERRWPGASDERQVFYVGGTAGDDFFSESTPIPDAWVRKADSFTWWVVGRDTTQRMHAINPKGQTTRVNYDSSEPIIDTSKYQ